MRAREEPLACQACLSSPPGLQVQRSTGVAAHSPLSWQHQRQIPGFGRKDVTAGSHLCSSVIVTDSPALPASAAIPSPAEHGRLLGAAHASES